MLYFKSLKIAIPVVLIGFFIVQPVFAGAWTRPRGGLYSQLTVNAYATDKSFDKSGNREDFIDNGEFCDDNISLYLEYGLADDLTVISSWSYKQLEYENDLNVNKSNGLSDLELGMKYRLFNRGSGACSLQTVVKIPAFYDDDESVPLGNGQYDVEARFLYGQSLYPYFPGYLNVEAGYRIRAEEPADELKYLIEVGADLTKKLYGRVKLDGTYGMGNAGNGSGLSENPSATFDYDLGKLEAVVGWKITAKWGTEFGFRKEIYGKNISAGANMSLAVTFQTP